MESMQEEVHQLDMDIEENQGNVMYLCRYMYLCLDQFG